jgi:hypothetical protein
LPDPHPKFQLFSKTLYDSRHRGTRVVMVKCDKENYEELLRMFNNLHEEKTLRFFAWKEFTSLNYMLRDVAFQKILNFNKHFRSVKLSGFRDNEDNIPMKLKMTSTANTGKDDPKDPLEGMLVSDFICTILAGNKSKMFEHVYEPIGGVRDTLVHIDNYTEAKEFAKVALAEIARSMTHTTRRMVFRDVDEVEADMENNQKWKPYTKAAELMEEKQMMQSSQPAKRTRTESGSRSPYHFWAKAAGGGFITKNQNENSTANTTPEINSKNSQTSINTTMVTKTPTWEDIQRHVEEQMETTTKILREEIQIVSKTSVNRMDEIDKKLEDYSSSTAEKLDKINKQGESTAGVVETRFNRLEEMFAVMMTKTSDNYFAQSKSMEFQLTRDDSLLKRKVDSSQTPPNTEWDNTNKENSDNLGILYTQPS